jgi:hypothetical protein
MFVPDQERLTVLCRVPAVLTGRRLKALRCSLVLSLALVAFAVLHVDQARATLYWSHGFGVLRANLDGSLLNERFIPGGPPSAPSGQALAACSGVAVDGSHLYWAEGDEIARSNLDGSGVNYDFITGLVNACGVAVDGQSIYWADNAAGTIGKADLAGGEVDREYVHGLESPCGVAAGGGSIYWAAAGAEPGESDLYRMSPELGMAQPIYLGGRDFQLCGVALDASHVYWGGFGKSIGRAGLDGSNPEPDFIVGVERPCGLALQGSRIYWTENDSVGAIAMTDLEGNRIPQRAIAGFNTGTCGIAADALTIFPPPPPPPVLPHNVHFGRVRHATRGSATYLVLELPGAGYLGVKSGPAVSLRVLPSGPSALLPAGPEQRVLVVRPGKGNRWARSLRSRLQRKGKAQVRVAVSFVATDGSTATSQRLVLLTDHHRRTHG